MKMREEVLAYCLSFPDTYLDAPFRDHNWQLVRYLPNKRAFAWTYLWEDGVLRVNVKVDPMWRDFWREAYPGVIPGYHQNKEHWNTLILDGSIPEKDVKRMLAESYDLVSKTYKSKSLPSAAKKHLKKKKDSSLKKGVEE